MDRREFLFQRKNRCVGQLLAELERLFTKYEVSESDREAAKATVKRKITSYHFDAIDVVQNSSDETRFNDAALPLRDKAQR